MIAVVVMQACRITPYACEKLYCILRSVAAEYHVHRSCRTAWAWVNARSNLLALDIFLDHCKGILADRRYEIAV